ncbi:hypothetical protein ACFU76_04780 [Streptomyces sp. NPDC057539]|uniref:hypothetical protein n=1 Tax=Streptomyces sp. NPDC057539 TaxID=3346159 RepID=UPI0036979BCA
MTRVPIGSRRRRFVGVGMGGALLGMLVALLFCLPSAAASDFVSASPSAAGTVGTVVAAETAGTAATAETVTGADGYGGRTPGCGRGDRDDAGTPPLAPVRGSFGHELLPALYDTRDTAGAWGIAQAVLAVIPDRGPPPVAAPSPIDLSVLLRV